jgi:hypothetical protein
MEVMAVSEPAKRKDKTKHKRIIKPDERGSSLSTGATVFNFCILREDNMEHNLGYHTTMTCLDGKQGLWLTNLKPP